MAFIDPYINDVADLCLKYKVKKLYAFGSVLTGRFSGNSDIDLIVDFHRQELDHSAAVPLWYVFQEKLAK